MIWLIVATALLAYTAGYLARRRQEEDLLLEAFVRGVRAEALARVLLEDVPCVTLRRDGS